MPQRGGTDGRIDSLGDVSEGVRPLAVLRRGLANSPELHRGIAATIAMAVFAAAGRLVVPVSIQLVLDHGVVSPAGYRPRVVLALALVALTVVVVVAVASRAVYIRMVTVAESVLLGLRVRVFEHIHRLSLVSHTRERRGVLLARVTSDVETLAAFIQRGAVTWVVNPVLVVAALTAMSVYSWQLTLLVVALHLPLLPFLRWVQRRQFLAHSRVRDSVSDMLAHTSEAVTGAAVIRSYGYAEPVRRRLDRLADRQYRARVGAHVWFTVMMPVVDLASSVALAAVIAAGAWWAAELNLGVGELVAFVFLVRMMLGPLTELGENLHQTLAALAGWQKILNVFDMPVEVAEPTPQKRQSLPDGPLALEMSGVCFAYDAAHALSDGVGLNPTKVLHRINVDIRADSNVAVVGETGSGKTTFARLAVRLVDPTEGVVRVGGVDLRCADPTALRRSIRMVPQDGFLFDGTVQENIRLGREGASLKEAVAALDVLGLRGWADKSARRCRYPCGRARQSAVGG